jgi:formylglycine-generating enzyme required for sulfatase activity
VLGVLSVLPVPGFTVDAQDLLKMAFVKVPAGEFMMGCSTGDSACNSDETPRHRVKITKGFEIGRYEVTQAQWAAVMQANPSGNKKDNHPVETVSKLEIQDFISKLNARQRRLPIPAADGGRVGIRRPRRHGFATPFAPNELAWFAGALRMKRTQ